MPDPMIGSYEDPARAERVEVITSVQRRRRWSTEEKVRIVEETYLPCATPAARSVGTRGALPWRRATPAGARTAWRSAATMNFSRKIGRCYHTIGKISDEDDGRRGTRARHPRTVRFGFPESWRAKSD